MSAANEAAASLVGGLAAELVDKIPVAGDDVLGREVAELRQSVEAEETPSSEEATVAQDEHETVEVPSYEREVPDDLLAELDEPDFEAEAEAEIESSEEDYSYDEQDSEERRKRIAAEKRAQFLEGRLAEQSRGKWEAEAKKYFPLSEHALANIKADSRRAYLREARAAHEAVLPYVKPLLERINESAEQTKTQAKAEGREEAEVAWGKATTGPGVVPSGRQAQSELEDARKSGASLAKRIGILMKQGG